MARNKFLKYWNPADEVLKNPSTNSEATGLRPFQNINSKPYYVMLTGRITRKSIQNQWRRMTNTDFLIPMNYMFRSSDSSTNEDQINLKIARPYIGDQGKSFYNYHLYCFGQNDLQVRNVV